MLGWILKLPVREAGMQGCRNRVLALLLKFEFLELSFIELSFLACFSLPRALSFLLLLVGWSGGVVVGKMLFPVCEY